MTRFTIEFGNYKNCFDREIQGILDISKKISSFFTLVDRNDAHEVLGEKVSNQFFFFEEKINSFSAINTFLQFLALIKKFDLT